MGIDGTGTAEHNHPQQHQRLRVYQHHRFSQNSVAYVYSLYRRKPPDMYRMRMPQRSFTTKFRRIIVLDTLAQGAEFFFVGYIYGDVGLYDIL